MYIVLSISLVIGYIFSLSLSAFTVQYIIRHSKKYGSKLFAFLCICTISISGFLYSTCYILPIFSVFSDWHDLLVWRLSLIFGFISNGFAILIYVYLKEYRKMQIIPAIYYAVLLGMLIGALSIKDSIQLHKSSEDSQALLVNPSTLNYSFSPLAGTIIIIFYFLVSFYLLYLSILIHKNARKDTSKLLIINAIAFGVPMMMFNLYMTFQITIFRELHILFFWAILWIVCFILILNPEVFLLLTNEIYYLNIYHKSGVLLYSYKFEKPENESDSAIWGNILIGINHILSEFINKEDQIDIMQTQKHDIIVNYNNEYGFAVLVITNKKNSIVESMKSNFMEEFLVKYKKELDDIQDYNKIIDVAEFADTKDIIEKVFQIFI